MSVCQQNKPETLVTVIMPAYNASAYIEAAIRSVMAQTYSRWKLLVIDDGSGDATCDIVLRLAEEDPRITLVRNEQNQGVARTRNRGLDMCESGCVAFLDSDDLWHPDKLSQQIEKMEKENAALVYSSYGIMDRDGNPCRNPYIVAEKTDFRELLKENVIGCSAVLLAQEVARTYRFVPDFHHEDYCLWLDILRDGHKAVGCSDVLMTWRLICGSRSFDKRNGARNRWRIYREHLHLPLSTSMISFASYALRGAKKYSSKRKGCSCDNG